MATKGGAGTSSRTDSADQDTGAELYLPEGSVLPPELGLSLFLLASINRWAILFCCKLSRVSKVE